MKTACNILADMAELLVMAAGTAIVLAACLLV